MDEAKKSLLKLHDLGIKVIKAEYHGGGDSGGIEDWAVYGDEDKNILITNTELTDLVIEELESIVHDKLNTIEDWWNNDGGWGHIIIKVPSGEYHIENNIYYTESEMFPHEGSF